MLHVWNICLLLAQMYGKCIGKYSIRGGYGMVASIEHSNWGRFGEVPPFHPLVSGSVQTIWQCGFCPPIMNSLFAKKNTLWEKQPITTINNYIYLLYTHQFSMDPNKKHLPKQKSRHGRASKDANKRRNELSINGSASIGFPPQILRREPTGGCGGRELPGFRAGDRLVMQGAAVRTGHIQKKRIHGNGMFITEFHCLW